MKVWNKIFATLGLFWLIFCVGALLLCMAAAIADGIPIYIIHNVLGWGLAWLVGEVILNFLRAALGSIWFETKQ